MECCVSPSERVRHGDLDAFAQVFDEYHLRILRYLCSLVGDGDLAEDLAQQTFVKAYRALAEGSPPENLAAWLYTIATRTGLSALRRRKLIAWLPLQMGDAARRSLTREPEARLGEQELVAQALAQLSKSNAACLLLRFQQGLSYEELAEVLGISVPAARMRTSRARAAFREAYLQLEQEASR
jgi:RNA polymerase sigma-70 factor (ECF subfamily)